MTPGYDRTAEPPRGCLGCNGEVMGAALRSIGIDPTRFAEVPLTARARAWGGDLLVCPECGRAWIALPTARRMWS
jgi:hypothetical protein